HDSDASTPARSRSRPSSSSPRRATPWPRPLAPSTSARPSSAPGNRPSRARATRPSPATATAPPGGGAPPPPGREQAPPAGARHLNKSDGLLRAGGPVISAFIERHREVWPVAVMCGALGVSPQGFYAWLGRPPGARQRRRDALLVQVRAAHAEAKE